MTEKVKAAISEFGMLSEGERVLVGLSGGADSVALMLVLIELGFEVFACHINHQLRGEESDRDERFCIELCKGNNIKLFVEKIDVITICKENRLGVEEGARLLRYQAFNKYSNGAKIATAHTLSDSLETTLINLTRGTALKGLCGIPPVRDNIIRPLINCTRADIEEYLNAKNQSYVIDSTNLSSDYTRNKIRHEVVPKLMEINPSLYNSFSKMVTTIIQENLYLDEVASSILAEASCGENEYSASVLLSQKKAITLRCIARILKDTDQECNSDKVTEIYRILGNNGKINLSRNVYAIVKSGKLKVQTIIKKGTLKIEQNLELENEIDFLDKMLYAKVKTFNQGDMINKTFTTIILDYDKIQGKAIVRNRRDGDKIKFLNQKHTTSIKTLFNSDIPLEKRDELIFLADGNGVIFVEGYGISERVRVGGDTKNVLELVITERN